LNRAGGRLSSGDIDRRLGARGVKPAAPPATGACPLERAPAATGAHAAAEAIGAGVGQAANRPPVGARCRTEAEAVRVTQHTGHRRTRHGPAARRWDGATDIGIPVVTLVAGIWPQTDDSAVLAQFTGESRSSKRSPRPKIHRSAHPVTGGTLAIQATTGFAAIFGAGGVVGGLIAKSLEG